MKLSFSTLGCPDWSFREIFSFASDQGFEGVEVRGIADQIYAPKIKAFSDEMLDGTKEYLARTHIEIPILTSGAYLIDNKNINAAIDEVKDYVILASKLGVKNVRVLGEAEPDPRAVNPDIASLAKSYSSLCEYAKDYGVRVLIETNGFLANSDNMKKLMERTESDNCGVIWDIHHTYRFFDEMPATTVKNIGKYIKHTHIKDSVKGRNGKITYMLSGYGDIPTEELYFELNNIGYDGYYSYEWVKRWSQELAEPGVAFFSYMSYMRGLE